MAIGQIRELSTTEVAVGQDGGVGIGDRDQCGP